METTENKDKTRLFRIYSDDAAKILESKYSIGEVVDMIKNGDVGISVDTIRGVNNATYVKAPKVYDAKSGEWSNTEFIIDGKQYTIPTITINNVPWFHFPKILKMLGLYTAESDSAAFEASIPYECKRRYSPFGKGIKRTFVPMEVLERFGLSSNGKPVLKRKVSLQYSGITVYNINLDYLTANVSRIMNGLDSMEDKLFMGEVYRVLKQLE